MLVCEREGSGGCGERERKKKRKRERSRKLWLQTEALKPKCIKFGIAKYFLTFTHCESLGNLLTSIDISLNTHGKEISGVWLFCITLDWPQQWVLILYIYNTTLSKKLDVVSALPEVYNQMGKSATYETKAMGEKVCNKSAMELGEIFYCCNRSKKEGLFLWQKGIHGVCGIKFEDTVWWILCWSL